MVPAKPSATRRLRSPLALLAAAALLASPACGSDVEDTSASRSPGAVCTPGKSEPCYSGAPGTQGAGLCKGGTRTCNPEGTAWSACEGEIVPVEEMCDGADNNCDGQVDEGNPEGGGACMTGELGACGAGALTCSGGAVVCSAPPAVVEACDTPADENCDGLGACDGTVLAGLHAGDGSFQGGQSVAADKAGNIVVGGYFEGALDLGGGPVVSKGIADAFVAKLDPDKKPIWITQCGGASNQYVNGLAVDSASSIIATGTFDGALSCGGDEMKSAGSYDMFAAKLDAGGAPVWVKRFGDAGDQRGMAVAVDPSDNALFAGQLEGSLDFGGGVVLKSAGGGGYDAFVAKLDASGNALFGRTFGGPGPQYASSVAASASGGVVVAGCFEGSMDAGGALALVSAGGEDVFVMKLDASGTTVWARSFGGEGDDCGFGVAVGGSGGGDGNITVVGQFAGTVDFGGGPLVSAGMTDLFILRLDPSGGTASSARYGDDLAYGYGVAVDGAGNTLLTGHFKGSIDFGAGAMKDTGNLSVFVAKLDPAGNGLWSKRFGGGGALDIALGRAIAADALGYVLVTGRFSGSLDVDGTTLAGGGADDLFLLKLAP